MALTASQSLPHKLTEKIQELNGFKSDDTATLVDAIEKAFLEFDSDLMQSKKFESGSTCTSILVTPTHYIFANVGDSRSVLVSRDKIRFETKDHKPTDFPGKSFTTMCGTYFIVSHWCVLGHVSQSDWCKIPKRTTENKSLWWICSNESC